MTNKKRKQMEVNLRNKLQNERDNNYPSFRKEITLELERYGIDSAKSKELVWSTFNQKMMEDIEWAQHMGVGFWARFIYEELNSPRKSKLTLNL